MLRVCKGKEMGRVGFKNVRDFNQALLCKWLWKLGSEDNELWL